MANLAVEGMTASAPEPPKRNISSFMHFSSDSQVQNELRRAFIKKHNISGDKVTKEFKDLFNEFKTNYFATNKQKYEQLADTDKKRYEAALADYEKKYGPVPKAERASTKTDPTLLTVPVGYIQYPLTDAMKQHLPPNAIVYAPASGPVSGQVVQKRNKKNKKNSAPETKADVPPTIPAPQTFTANPVTAVTANDLGPIVPQPTQRTVRRGRGQQTTTGDAGLMS